jgi:hypothetical protein
VKLILRVGVRVKVMRMKARANFFELISESQIFLQGSRGGAHAPYILPPDTISDLRSGYRTDV